MTDYRRGRRRALTAREAGRLDRPIGTGPRMTWWRIDDETVGRLSENVARFFGTARFLIIQTILVACWITLNVAQLTQAIHWDPYPFILLNLAFSTQAAYAAPLILLAQNRQAHRDRVALEEDRATNARSMADMEYLAREVAAIRIALGEVATRDFIRSELARRDGERDEERRTDG